MSNPTTPFGWQMPTNTDLVTDLPADFEVFGQAVATSLADLNGGTTGQVLAKASNADMDFVWSADAAGMTNPMTTTGDVIYSSPGSTPVRLGIGSTGNVLTVAGGVPTWAAPASSGGMTLISETVASANASLSLSSIPGTYKQLLLVWRGIYHSNTGSNFGIRLNNDSTADKYQGSANGGVTGGASASGVTYDYIVLDNGTYLNYPFGSSVNYSTSAIYSQVNGQLLIDNYASTSKYKSYTGSWGYYWNASPRYLVGNINGSYNSTSAVTSIDIVRLTGSETFTNATNTSIRLYGIS